MAIRTAPTRADIEAARRRLDGVVRRTPVFSSDTIGRRVGRPVFLKAENLQRTGSFKVRGALNKLATLSAEERAAGVVASSAGNHGQAVALAAREAGIRATVFMPLETPMAKIEATKNYGAEVVLGGEVPEGPGAFYPPTVLGGVEGRMVVAQEEIFGPVVTAIPFEDEKDAIRIANDVKYGLMATVWTGDPARGHRLASRIKAGTVGINMPYTAFPGLPFGGYKQSGFGRELGIETLELYLETKSVTVNTGSRPINPFGL